MGASRYLFITLHYVAKGYDFCFVGVELVFLNCKLGCSEIRNEIPLTVFHNGVINFSEVASKLIIVKLRLNFLVTVILPELFKIETIFVQCPTYKFLL
mgnify:CR=1 FL=1